MSESLNERIQTLGRAALVKALNADREAERLLEEAAHPSIDFTNSPERGSAIQRQHREQAARLQALAVENRRIAEYAQRGYVFASHEQVRTGELFKNQPSSQTFNDAFNNGLVVWEDSWEASTNSAANGAPFPRSS